MELFGLDSAELSQYFKKLGHSSFRGKQAADWLYKKSVRDIAQMTNIPAVVREQLAGDAVITRSEIIKESRAKDGTTKFLLKLADGETIESVLLPYSERTSVCVSTQVGCAAGCLFCATAECGFVRNLTAGEIVDQVLTLQERGGARVTHVVFMGMGEPLLNFDNLLKAIHLLNKEVGIGMRHITVSTVGITPVIQKLKELDLQITLAVSLHAPDDDLRHKIVPLSTKFILNELIAECKEYANSTKRRITFEYLMLAGVNDSVEQALALAKLLRGIMCHVNLIPYNEVAGKEYRKPSKETITGFRQTLEEEGVEVTQRMERGQSVSAACGQLRNNSSFGT